jgi:hypothetical protein
MRSMRARLERLERQVGRPPTVQELNAMSDAELFDLAGLPPHPSPEEIDALIAALEENLARTASGGLSGNAPG